MLVATDAAGYAACCGAIERMDLREQLPRDRRRRRWSSPAPTTPPRRPSTSALIAAAIPGARHEVVGAAAHIAAVEQPEAVNRLILEHLR